MESIVYEDSPLANYLRGTTPRFKLCVSSDCHGGRRSQRATTEDADADASEPDWAPVATSSERALSTSSIPSSPPLSPTPFAPTGRPLVKARFRRNPPAQPLSSIPRPREPQSLRSISRNCSVRADSHPLREDRRTFSNRSTGVQAVVAAAANIDGADNAKFLEKFRYTIVASQLLSGHSALGQPSAFPESPITNIFHDGDSAYSTQGMVTSVAGALLFALALSWILGSGPPLLSRKRLVVLLVLIPAGVVLGQVLMRRQWLRFRRQQSLSEISTFVQNSQEFDGASSAALALIQEVELVSRGYRL